MAWARAYVKWFVGYPYVYAMKWGEGTGARMSGIMSVLRVKWTGLVPRRVAVPLLVRPLAGAKPGAGQPVLVPLLLGFLFLFISRIFFFNKQETRTAQPWPMGWNEREPGWRPRIQSDRWTMGLATWARAERPVAFTRNAELIADIRAPGPRFALFPS